MKTWLIQLLAILTLSSNPVVGSVRCLKPRTPADELAQSAAVFSGKVVAMGYEPLPTEQQNVPPGSKILTIKMNVDRWWKGGTKKTVTLVTSSIKFPDGREQLMLEGFEFQLGERYLVYAFIVNGQLQTNGCRRTRLLTAAGDDLKEIGLGKKPIHK